VVAKPGAVERLASLRAETLEEIRLYELRHGEAVSQAELAGRLDVTQGAISKLEHSDDVRVSTLRQYLEALGARLELVAVFDDDDRRVPIHLAATTQPDRAGVSSVSARLAPTGSYGRLRQRCSAVPIRSFIREDADERRRAHTGVGLITRRSWVQIPPPPPSKVEVRPGAQAPGLLPFSSPIPYPSHRNRHRCRISRVVTCSAATKQGDLMTTNQQPR
jgi:transcriptional regulator with XRE-family HTH domain